MEKKIITSGYNFVPLEKAVYFPEWADRVSQDIPFSDGEDGIIEVSITNVTPLFVGGPQNEGEKAYSCHVIRNGKKRYFIPGSTIKGCLRNVLEVISFAKIGDHTASSIGYRDVSNPTSQYAADMKGNVRCGWMYKEDDSFYIYKCNGRLQKIIFEDLRKKFPGFYEGQDHETAQKIQESLAYVNGGELYPRLSVGDDEIHSSEKTFVPQGEYRVVCTGYMKGKNVAYLFPDDLEGRIKIDKDVLDVFLSIHENTEYFGSIKDLNTFDSSQAFLLKRLMNSNRPDNGIPVFFRINNENKIINIGITRMYRVAYPLTVDGAIRNVSNEHLDNKKHDLPETMFGYIANAKNSSEESANDSLKGRIQFTPAFMDKNVTVRDEDCDKLCFTGVLGQPKASFWPLYLDQNSGRSSYENTSARIAGRKRYRIIDGKVLVVPDEGNGNENVKDTFYPIPSGNKFTFRIGVHNLRKIEIGALLSSLTFNGNGGCYHNIGKAKSFGYGKILFKVEKLDHFQYKMEDYLEAFNSEMSWFYQIKNDGKKLADAESLKALISIASDTHKADDMKQPKLEDFDDYKKRDVQTVLPEKIRQYQVGIDESGIASIKLQAELDSIMKKMESTNDTEKAANSLNELHDFIALHNINDKKFEEKITEAKKVVEGLRQKNSSVQNAILNAKASQMSLAERLVNVTSAKNVPGAVASWMRQSGKAISETEIDAIIAKLNGFTPKPNIASKNNRSEYEKKIGKEATELLLSKYQC